MGFLSAPAPQIVQPVDQGPADTPATVDKTGLQDWMKGIVSQAATGSAQKAHQSGFNLGQAAMLGGGGQSSIFGRTKAFG